LPLPPSPSLPPRSPLFSPPSSPSIPLSPSHTSLPPPPLPPPPLSLLLPPIHPSIPHPPSHPSLLLLLLLPSLPLPPSSIPPSLPPPPLRPPSRPSPSDPAPPGAPGQSGGGSSGASIAPRAGAGLSRRRRGRRRRPGRGVGGGRGGPDPGPVDPLPPAREGSGGLGTGRGDGGPRARRGAGRGRPSGALPLVALLQLAEGHIANTESELKQLAEQHPDLRDAYLAKQMRLKSKLRDHDNVQYLNKILDELEKVLDQVEMELQRRNEETPEEGHPQPWLCCEAFTLADVSLAVTLHRLSFLGLAQCNWGAGKRPNLEAYYERVQRRETFRRVLGRVNNILLSAVLPTALHVARRKAPRILGTALTAGLLAGAAYLALTLGRRRLGGVLSALGARWGLR
uniref:Ganglioside induced differentiation associated protein 1 n=1 Tax=Ornithorhynchus anatinus TaxID=9258 RepID=A0A6I8NFL8_ORNAN